MIRTREGVIACYKGIQVFVIKEQDIAEKLNNDNMYIIQETGEIIYQGFHVGNWNFENNNFDFFREKREYELKTPGRIILEGDVSSAECSKDLFEIEFKNIEMENKEG